MNKPALVQWTVLAIILRVTTVGATWQSYVDDNLIGSGHIKKAAIIGLDSNNTLAHNPSQFKVTHQEATYLLSLFKTNGLRKVCTLDKKHYTIIKADYRSVYGTNRTAGFASAKSSRTLVIGVYVKGMPPGAAQLEVEKLVDYLIENDY